MSNDDRDSSYPSNRDAHVARAWREASDEQPPSPLDAAIIAAARKAVPVRGLQPNVAAGRTSRHGLLQWQPLAAAATVAGLAFILVQQLPRDTTDLRQVPGADTSIAAPERDVVLDRVPAQSVAAEPPAAPAATPSSAPVPAPPAALPAPPAPLPAMPEASAPGTAVTADAAVASGETRADRREVAEPEMAGRTATAAAALPASSARERALGKASGYDSPAWAAQIAALHRSGDVTQAANALREFRAADADADTYLPDSLREWARTVQ